MTTIRLALSDVTGAPPPTPAAVATAPGLLRAAEARLAVAGVPTPCQDAEALLAHALGTTRLGLYTAGPAAVPAAAGRVFETLVARRARHEPVQYLLGATEFGGLTLAVGTGVFIPRPETEGLVDRALTLGPAGAGSVVELCTGSGAVACALATRRRDWGVWAVERAAPAVDCARANVVRLGLEERVRVLAGHLFEPLRAHLPMGAADLVVANPPYLASSLLPTLPVEVRDWEPPAALDGGADGLDVIRPLIREAPRWLRPGGGLLVEIGEEHGPTVRTLVETDGHYVETRVHRDFRGCERVLEARRR
jgi:release factor glutamine methyltransferase